MLPMKGSYRAQLWLRTGLWMTSAIAGSVSIILAFSVIFNSEYQKSGISILHFNFTTLLPSRLLYDSDQAMFDIPSIPEATSINVPPIIATAAGAVASGVQAAESSISSDLQAVATDAAAAVQSGLDTIVPRNMTIGLEKICLGWDNSTSPKCHNLPFNVSSIVPGALSDILGGPFRLLQAVEEKVVSAVLTTVRRSLIAAVVLLLFFFLLLLFWEFPNDLWKRAIMTPLGFACIVVPFLISMIVLLVVQSDIQRMFAGSSLVSVQSGEVGKLVTVGFIFSTLMFVTTVVIMVI